MAANDDRAREDAVRTGGQWTSNAPGENGMASARPGPQGPGGGAEGANRAGTGGNGSLQGASYNNSGRVTGHDSPAGDDVELDAGGQGQGDDLADRIGDGEGRGSGVSGAGAASGDLDAGRSEGSRGGAVASGLRDDAGAPGGMGGVGAPRGAGGRPPGGLSPVEADEERSE